MDSLDAENTKRGGAKSRFYWQIQFKSSDVDEHMILPDVPCGHFALGTCSKTCLKDVVFDIKVRR